MPNPIMDAGSDVTIVYGSLPTTQALTGSATVFSPGTVISTWTWTLLEKPTGSAAALSSTSVQNPTLNGIDTVGTYRLFLQGTDDAAQASESDYIQAPTSALVTVSVTTQFAALAKPAPGQRDWNDEYWGLVDEVDTQRNDHDTHAADTTDPHNTLSVAGTVVVADAPAAAGEILTSTSTTAAAWGAPGAYSAAAVGTLGTIETAETPFSPTNPKAVVRDKVCYGPTKALGTLLSTGFSPWVVGIPAAALGGGSGPSPFHVVWYIPFAFTLVDVVATIEDSGVSGSYTIQIYSMSTAQYLSNVAGTLEGTVTLSAAASAPGLHVLAVGNSIGAGRWIGAVVTGEPTTLGGGLSIQLNGYQEF